MKLLLKTIDKIHTAEMSGEFIEKLSRVAGQWVTVDTKHLFDNQYNIVEENIRIMESYVADIKDDVRPFVKKCKYCGSIVPKEATECPKEGKTYVDKDGKTCKNYGFEDLYNSWQRQRAEEKADTEREVRLAKGTTKKWLKKLQGDTLSKSDINALKRIWERQDTVFWDTATNKETEEALEERRTVIAAMEKRIKQIGGFKLTEDQTKQGIAYLKSQCYTPKGTRRAKAPLHDFQAELLDNLAEFRFMGFYDFHQNPHTQCYISAPIYKVIGKRANGLRDTFTYHCGSWQSGSNQVEVH